MRSLLTAVDHRTTRLSDRCLGSSATLGRDEASGDGAASVRLPVEDSLGARGRSGQRDEHQRNMVERTRRCDDRTGQFGDPRRCADRPQSFINPLTYTFTFPSNTGISFSFTDDGHFEEAQFRYAANSTRPHCVTAYLIWQHGTYTLQPNGSITTQPIAADGRIQVQNRCEAMSSVITYYNQPGLYQGWQITNDQTHNQFMLQMTAFDNSLMPRLYLAYRPPQMWSSA